MIAPFEQNITFLYTQNMAQTARFYEEVLGLPLVRDQGTCRIYRISQDGFIGFCQHLTMPQNPGAIILTLVTDDVDGWYQRLVAKGVAFDKPPAQNEKFDIYHCFLRDPNGYLLEIQRFDQPL
jgi:catechol 2,3-dioxygenase-like lactoylglutathione lyase family enzyme